MSRSGVSAGLFQHAVQMRSRILDIEVLALARATLGGEDATTVDALEVAVREFVVRLRLLCFGVVYAQVPLAIFAEAEALDELAFCSRTWLVLAPIIPLVQDEL